MTSFVVLLRGRMASPLYGHLVVLAYFRNVPSIGRTKEMYLGITLPPPGTGPIINAVAYALQALGVIPPPSKPRSPASIQFHTTPPLVEDASAATVA